MRARILASVVLLGAVGLFGSCSLFDSATEALNLLHVNFSSDDPAYSGPTVGGPSWVTAAAQLALPSGWPGSLTKEQVLGEYYLELTFRVRADNSQNSQRAAFPKAITPALNIYINSKSNTPVKWTMDTFSIEGGQVKPMFFPVHIPLDLIDRTVLRQILNGDKIPYFLTASLDFNLMEGLTIKGTGVAEVDLASGAIPTRPSGDIDLAGMASKLF